MPTFIQTVSRRATARHFVRSVSVITALLAGVVVSPSGAAEIPSPATAALAPSTALSPTAPVADVTSTERTIARWRKVTEDTPAQAPAWVQLGDALMQRSREITDFGLYDQAAAAYTKALSLSPTRTDAMIGLAWVHNTRHQFERGCDWARQALKLDPKVADAHALLGDAALEWGDYDSALTHYQDGLDAAPNLASYSRAAHLLWRMGDSRKALWLMQKAIDAGGPYPENVAWCRAEKSRMLWHEGALLPAEQEATKALALAPKNHHALAAMGRVKMARKDYAGAIESLEQSAEVQATYDALVLAGDLHAWTGQPEKAEASYRRVVAWLKAHQHSHSHGEGDATHTHEDGDELLAKFYAEHDRNLDEAVRQGELAWSHFKNPGTADALAWSYYKKGLLEQAQKMMRHALKWNTPDASYYFHSGMIHARLGQRAIAQKHLYRALSLNPHFHPRDAALATETLNHLGTTTNAVTKTPTAQPVTPAH